MIKFGCLDKELSRFGALPGPTSFKKLSTTCSAQSMLRLGRASSIKCVILVLKIKCVPCICYNKRVIVVWSRFFRTNGKHWCTQREYLLNKGEVSLCLRNSSTESSLLMLTGPNNKLDNRWNINPRRVFCFNMVVKDKLEEDK